MHTLMRSFIPLVLFLVFGCSAPTEPTQERTPQESPGTAAPPPRDQGPNGPTSGPRGQNPLNDLVPGTFRTIELQPQFTVFDGFESALSELDRGIGTRIQSMYKTTEQQGWKKEGPALVAVRGPLDGPTVQAEVTFALSEDPVDATKFGLQKGTLPGGSAVVGMHKGSRASLATTSEALNSWMTVNGKSPQSQLRWFVFLNRPDQVTEGELLTAVVQPIN